jgi:signal transduction histidine kinase
MLFWSIASLTVAIVAAVLVIRQTVLAQVDARIDAALEQEADELRSLSSGRDPLTGQRFGEDVERILEVFLERNLPTRNEIYLTFVDGQLVESTRQSSLYPLESDAALMARWRDLETPERGGTDTPAGRVEYLAVPIRSQDRTLGVFVAAIFRDLEAEEVDTGVRAAVEVGLILLLLGSVIAWRVAEGVLRPVRAVTATARSISTADLTRRIPVVGNDEVSELSRTFNTMLDQLEEAFDTQQRFVDDAGHELRTPITVIRGHLELLDDDPIERQDTLALVDDELERMNRIVNDLLTLAKAERPDFLRFEPIDLATLTEEVHAKASALGLRDWQLAGVGRGIIVGDRQRLTQAMMQLAQNAVQHTTSGARIELGSRLQRAEASLWVADAGEGIRPDELDRIFDRFARAQQRRASDGAGLGLSIVQPIVDAHHGRIDVQSQPGEGTTFTLWIPADQPVGDSGEAG